MDNNITLNELIDYSDYNCIMLNENIIKRMLTKIKSKTIDAAKKLFKNSFMKAVEILKKAGKEKEALAIINSNFGVRFTSLDQITKEKVSEDLLLEDWKNYWETLKAEGFPALSFYPALTAWLELGKLLEPDASVSFTKVGVYGGFWLALVSGKFVKEFYKWKKENPEEYYAERPGKKEKDMAKLQKKMDKLKGK